MSDLILTQHPADHVTRLVLNRVETRNAQSTRLLYELNDAFDAAAQDDACKVIVLAAEGPHFSSGHDLRDTESAAVLEERKAVGTWGGFTLPGSEGWLAREKEIYLGFSERWRNLPKPTIAEVQGKVIAGGLMLVWPCDLIVAADDAEFQDNTVSMGVCGVEFFQHPFEVGVRKAKEMLFTSESLSAEEARQLGMVNHVVPRERLAAFTLELAEKIATKPLFALKTSKEAVNAAQDIQGRQSSMQTALALHQLCHAHNQVRFGHGIDPTTFQSKLAPGKTGG